MANPRAPGFAVIVVCAAVLAFRPLLAELDGAEAIGQDHPLWLTLRWAERNTYATG